jgi:hypothetical protein
MTLPDERYRSIKMAELFLTRLAGGEYLRVPKAVREEARSILRHYPGEYDLTRLAVKCPEVIQEHMDDLHRMVLKYEAQTPEHLKGDLNHSGECDLEARQQP